MRLSSDQISTGDIIRRIVRLTIETNSVTGKSRQEISRLKLLMTLVSAIVAVAGFIMAVVIPVSHFLVRTQSFNDLPFRIVA